MAASSSRQRIVVAMSGGVDSSLTAALLQRQGHEVVGVTLRLYDQDAAAEGARTCCAGRDICDARAVADRLGIAHYVLDYRERFRRQVVDDFVAEYAAGKTPIPCVHCNGRIKFGELLEAARDLGAGALATGHYARLILGPEGAELHRAVDKARDQSYFLFSAARGTLAALRFPLGGMCKTEVRAAAAELGLVNAAKPDSQDICFVPRGRYDAVVDKLRPQAARPGEIVDAEGRVLGRHDGIIRFTVGQRKRLGISGREEPLFVLRLDAETAQVVVGPREALACREFRLGQVNWLAAPEEAADCAVKVRSMREPVPARVMAEGTGAHVALRVPEYAVAPGQACVFYKDTRVLGGGWIV
jgi:tRNA-uridine 2-sulfurtransferase